MQSTDTQLLDALFTVIAEHGWRGVTPGRLAALSGIPAGELVRRFPSRLDLLRLHADAVAESVSAGTVPGQGGTPRDRVFDVLMRGVDALLPHRAGMLRLISDMRRDGVLAVALAPILQRSMERMLEAAELDSSGLQGKLRAAGLVGVWLMTIRAWEKDDTVDMGPTMAALDRALDRAEQTARSLRIEPGDRALPPDLA
ncbi:TetR family transcriptional regulator [Falsiroseomonas tokyonensis]|uniref:TetR family transcriptional regulator n=1 Tax=Falsiroseomonas tokyonensis TaxID=430521 RepID=A0ABV7BVZ1_9PROT|nr:TetR family transcriptional regulator [Falsiroseomonas tokyonensis]MBU8539703.1 TetR family transcriptional regulator [Falsiroseomonas tokyonensis]